MFVRLNKNRGNRNICIITPKRTHMMCCLSPMLLQKNHVVYSFKIIQIRQTSHLSSLYKKYEITKKKTYFIYKNSFLIQICVFKIVQKYIIRTVDSHYVLTLILGIFSLRPTRI